MLGSNSYMIVMYIFSNAIAQLDFLIQSYCNVYKSSKYQCGASLIAPYKHMQTQCMHDVRLMSMTLHACIHVHSLMSQLGLPMYTITDRVCMQITNYIFLGHVPCLLNCLIDEVVIKWTVCTECIGIRYLHENKKYKLQYLQNDVICIVYLYTQCITTFII